MTTTPFFHGTFALKRTWAASPDRVFSVWADPKIKSQRFTGPSDEWALMRRSIDFRPGGTEVLEGRFKKSGLVSLFEARFHLIEQDRRFVYDHDLHHGGNFHSVTLSSLTLEPEGRRTVAETNSFESFVLPGNVRFRAAVAFYPPCRIAGERPGIPTLILIGPLDDWTPAADCSQKVVGWGTEGPPIELITYPNTHHGSYYLEL